jgi:predicted RNase H-like nuclease (RuvC/YqgF family)
MLFKNIEELNKKNKDLEERLEEYETFTISLEAKLEDIENRFLPDNYEEENEYEILNEQ